jgi:hypothetical protein
VGVQGVVLEDEGDVAVLGVHVVHHPVTDDELAVADRLEAGHHPQGGRLAAARGADQDDELAVGDVEVQVVDGVEAVLVDLVDVLQLDVGHERPPIP